VALLAVFAIRGSDYACRVVARHPPDGGETSTGDANRPRPGGPPSRPPSPCGDAHDHRRKPAQRGTGSSRRDNAPVRAIKGDTSGQGPGDTAAAPATPDTGTRGQPPRGWPGAGRWWSARTGAPARACSMTANPASSGTARAHAGTPSREPAPVPSRHPARLHRRAAIPPGAGSRLIPPGG